MLKDRIKRSFSKVSSQFQKSVLDFKIECSNIFIHLISPKKFTRTSVPMYVPSVNQGCLAGKGPPKSREHRGFKPRYSTDVVRELMRVNDRANIIPRGGKSAPTVSLG